MKLAKFAGMAGFLAAALIALMAFSTAPVAATCASGSGVDVYGLDVHGSVISAYVKNTGTCDKPIYYTLYIDGGVVATGDFTLASGSLKYFEKNYNFGYGSYEVKLTVTDRCSSDFDRIEHIVLEQPKCGSSCDCATCGNACAGCSHVSCTDGWKDEYRCADGWTQRKYVDGNCEIKWYNIKAANCDSCSCNSAGCNCDSGCSGCAAGTCAGGCNNCNGCNTWQDGWLDNYRCSGSEVQRWFVSGGIGGWKDWTSCANGCKDGKCMDACGVDITAMNFKDRIVQGERTDITVNARNLADDDQIISLALYVDGARKDSYSAWVDAGSTLIKDFFLYPDRTATIRIEASSTCGGNDFASSTLNVIQKTTEEAYTPTDAAVPVTAEETSVYIYPDSMDLELGSSKVIAIDIKSKRTQDFTIDVSGVPDSWLSYDKRAGVSAGGKKTAYVYVTGKELGMKSLVVTVKAAGENVAFKQNVALFVAKNVNVIRVDWTGDFVAGAVALVTSAWFLLAIVVIILIIVIACGAYNLKYYEY